MAEPTELQTDRLLLRPWSLADVGDLLSYADDPEWAEFLPPVPIPYTRGDAEVFVARNVLASWEIRPVFAIAFDSTVIGAVNLDIESQNLVGSLGYALARRHWGKGLMPEAVRAVIDWAFGELGLARVFSLADLRNERSWRVMEKVGMRREGIFRSARPVRSGRADDVYYAILRKEWEATRD